MADVAVLPKLNVEAVCPKCGCPEVRFNYTAGTLYDCRRMDPECYGVEHMHRTCTRCHFQWAEDIARDPDDVAIESVR